MTGRRGVIAGLVAATLAVMSLGVAQAEAKAIDTQIGDLSVDCGQDPDPDTCIYSGFIDSKKKCLADRKVKMFALFMGGEQKLADTDKTSAHGAFGGRGITGNVSAAKVKVLKKTVRGDTCKGATFTGA
jgi:hypothetical protein